MADGLKAAREEDRLQAGEGDRLQKEREGLQKQRAEREAKINGEEATRVACLKSVAAAMKALTADWQAVAERAGLTEVHTLSDEKEQLEARRTEARFKELEGGAARRRGAAAADRRAGRRGRAGAGRRAPRPARGAVAAARSAAASQGARRRLPGGAAGAGQAGRPASAAPAAAAQVLEVEGEYNVLLQLATLLGRDRLQLYLVRQAERQIVDHANAVLDRLSGGQLYLRLRGGEAGEAGSEQALELEAYNRTTGGQPINVAFLSRQPAVPRGGEPGAGHRPVRQPAAPADRVGHHRRGLRLPRPPRPAGDDPGAAEPARPAALHPAGVAPGGVRRRLQRRLPLRAERGLDGSPARPALGSDHGRSSRSPKRQRGISLQPSLALRALRIVQR